MKLFKSNIETLRRASPASGLKRFLSSAIDAVLVFFVTYGLFWASYGIFQNNSGYKQNMLDLESCISNYEDNYAEPSHVVEYQEINGEKTTIPSDITLLNIMARDIILSFENDPSSFNVASLDFGGNLEAVASTYDNNNIGYFYTTYIPDHNEYNGTKNVFVNYGSYTPKAYFNNLLKKSFASISSNFFVNIDENAETYPVMNGYIANAIYEHYVYLSKTQTDSSVKDNSEGSSYYESYYSIYDNLFSSSKEMITNSEPYHSEGEYSFLRYVECRNYESNCYIYSIMMSSLVAYLLCVLLPKLIFKDSVTIGRKLFSIGVIDRGKVEIQWYSLLGESVLGSCFFCVINILLPLFPPFNVNYGFYSIPLFYIGNLGFSYLTLIIISTVVLGINGLTTLLMHYKTSIEDLLLHTLVVDKTHLDEEDYDEPEKQQI